MITNRVQLIGIVGKDAEMRETSGNKKVVTFSMATNESYKDKNGEWQEITDWHNVVFWRNPEKAEKEAKKGVRVLVEGKLKTRSYDDKEGKKRYITEVVGETLLSFPKSNNQPNEINETKQNPEVSGEPVDDLPF